MISGLLQQFIVFKPRQVFNSGYVDKLLFSDCIGSSKLKNKYEFWYRERSVR